MSREAGGGHWNSTGLYERWRGSALEFTARASSSYGMCPVLLDKLSPFSCNLARASWCLQPWDFHCWRPGSRQTNDQIPLCMDKFLCWKQATPVKMYWMPFLEKWFCSHISEWPELMLMLPSLLTGDMKMLCRGSMCSWIVGRIFFFFFLQLFLPWLFLSLPNSCSWTLVLEVKVQLWHARVRKGTFSSASNLSYKRISFHVSVKMQY